VSRKPPDPLILMLGCVLLGRTYIQQQQSNNSLTAGNNSNLFIIND